ncbi:MAG: hypothetical protein ACXU86_14050, partial [Archangium sp.]
SPEGAAMTAALIEGMQGFTPHLLDGLPASMIHFFLDQDQFQGVNVADLLRVPKPDWTVIIPRAAKTIGAVTDWVGDHTYVAAKLLRYLSRDIVGGMLLVQRGGQRAPFYIPDHLQDRWRIKPAIRGANAQRRADNEAAVLATAQAEQNDSNKQVA